MNKKVQERKFFLFVFIFLLVFVTRFLSRTKFLYDWDSVQFALGMQHFDVSLFQPHPPGYLFYVFSAKVINFAVHDENTSLVLLSILGSALALFFTFLLGKEIFGRKVGFRTAALLFTSPLFWMFGEVGNPDIFDCAFSVWFVYLVWRVFKGEQKLLPWASFLLGIAGGFRTGLFIFMGPLWLCAVFYPPQKMKSFLANTLILFAATATWLCPTVFLTGGIQKYSQSFLEVSHSFLETSMFQAGIAMLLKNMFYMAASVLFSGLCMFSIVFLSILPLLFLTAARKLKEKQIKPGANSFLFLMWVVPATLFLCTLHFGSFAFGLFFLPPFFLASVKILNGFAGEISKKGLRIPPFVYSVLPALLFIFLNGMISYVTIPQFVKNNNLNWERRKNAVQSIPPPQIVILSSFEQNAANYYRHVTYYLPEYRAIFIPDILTKNSAKKNAETFHGKVRMISPTRGRAYNAIPLPEGINYVGIIDPLLLKMKGHNNDYFHYIDARGKKVIRYKYNDFELK